MDCSMPGLPIHHQLPEFTQTHVHWVGDAIQPSHPLSFLSPPAFNLSPHQGLFKWVNSLHQVAKVLEFQLQHQSFQWIFRTGSESSTSIWYTLQICWLDECLIFSNHFLGGRHSSRLSHFILIKSMTGLWGAQRLFQVTCCLGQSCHSNLGLGSLTPEPMGSIPTQCPLLCDPAP